LPLKPYHLLIGALTAAPSLALAAEDPEPPSLPSADEAPEQPAQESERISALEQRIEALQQRLSETEEADRQRASSLTFNGYIDFGFFAPNGNGGVGWIRDVGHTHLPQYSNYGWTFLGDLLSTAVNSRGEAADLGAAPEVNRFDSVHSGGAPGFIVNETNLRLGWQVSDSAIARTSINFVPRSGIQDFSLGDFVDIDLAELEWVLTRDGKTSLFVGKTLPVFGIEYKERKADQRFGITPSLVYRYTSGSQLGIKLRSKLFNDWLILAGSVTNNTSVIEPFHFYSEIDRNWGKTLNGRAAINIPVERLGQAVAGHRLEIGGSGEWGPQDVATDVNGKIWFAGPDLQYLAPTFALKAQAVWGGAPGREVDRAWHLKLKSSGYVELQWQALPMIGFLARVDRRDAFVSLGTERLYITKEIRFTGGLHIVFTPRAILKFEYLRNREFGGLPQFQHDVFTSSLVLAF
jgi:hypothetical protein